MPQSHQWDVHRHGMFLLTPVRARGNIISPIVLHKNLLLHRLAKKAKVRVEVEDKAHSGLKGHGHVKF